MSARVPGSFRDPSGFVFVRDGEILRQVNERFRDSFDAFIHSGCYEALVDDDLLIRHQDVDVALALTTEACRVLRPEPIRFISYPYEWSFSQLKAAALTTLSAQSAAMSRGMWLKDASAYNIQFRGTRPVLIDTLSFEPLVPGQPWPAYGQFCRHFLAPLALMSLGDPRLGRLQQSFLDGIPLDLASRLLPRRTKLRPSLGLHLHAHAAASRRTENPNGRHGRFGARALTGLVESLRGAVEALDHTPSGQWVDYGARPTTYSAEGRDHKRTLVGRILDQVQPRTVWDLGANTGEMARLASTRGIATIAMDSEHDCVDTAYRQAVETGDAHLLPLVMDLANPSPGIGLEHSERSALTQRGPTDLILALALVHHLCLGNNVPLDRFASLLGSIGRAALVEFVPPGDPMAQELVRRRENVFPGYNERAFIAAMNQAFVLHERLPVTDSERVLFLFGPR